MTRYRALLFGHPLAPWQATKQLAEQSAIDAGEGSRKLLTGQVFLAAGVVIDQDDGPSPDLTPEMERWAEALRIFALTGERAEKYVADRIAALVDDPAGQARWRQIGRRVAAIQAAAAKDARR